MEDKETTILDHIFVLLKWRKFIFLLVFLTGLVTAGVTLILPVWYEAAATIFIADSSGMGVSALMPNLDFSFGGFFDTGSEENRYISILNSRGAKEHIIKKFDLQNQYNIESMEETIRALGGHVDFGLTKEDALYVSVEDKSAQRASDMTNEYVKFLDTRNRELLTEQASSNRIFIENRYLKNKLDLKAAEDSLNVFQETRDVLSPDDQITASLDAYTEIYKELQLKIIEYDIASINYSSNNPLLLRLKFEVEALRENLRKFEGNSKSFKNTDFTSSFYIPFNDIPQVIKEYARLLREVETQNSIYIFLTQQYESAKLQEAKDTPTLLVLDGAVPPERKSRPKRAIIVLIFSGIAFIFSVCTAITFEYFGRLQRTSPVEKQKMDKILNLLKKKPKENE